MKIKDVIYKNQKFRSMLDVRWAIYFEKMGIDYEYSGNVVCFWLPQVNMFAAVNRYKFTKDEDEILKAVAKENGNPVLRLIGIPDYITYMAWDSNGDETDHLVSAYHGYCSNEHRFYKMTEAEGMHLAKMRNVIYHTYGSGMKEAITHARSFKLSDELMFSFQYVKPKRLPTTVIKTTM